MSRPIKPTSTLLQQHRLRRTAIHESGHATIAITEGCGFESIVIGRDGDSAAMVRNPKRKGGPGDDEYVRLLLGGMIAARLSRCRWDRALFDGSDSDLRKVAAFYKDHDAPVKWIKWNIDQVHTSLHANWAFVEDLAVTLIQSKSVQYDEVINLFERTKAMKREARPFGKTSPDVWGRLESELHIRIAAIRAGIEL